MTKGYLNVMSTLWIPSSLIMLLSSMGCKIGVVMFSLNDYRKYSESKRTKTMEGRYSGEVNERKPWRVGAVVKTSTA